MKVWPPFVEFPDGTKREVKLACLSCVRTGRFKGDLDAVSPTGVIHDGKGRSRLMSGGRTLCGKDASGPEWWWAR